MMKASRGVLTLVLAGVLVTSLLAGCAGGGAGTSGGSTGGTAASQTMKIGAVISLTGSYAALGASQKNVIDMEVARINDAGGVNGRKIDVLVQDDNTDAAKALTAVTKLVEQDNVLAVMGASGTGQSMGMRPEIDRAGVPEISMAGGNAITSNFDKLVFQTPWPNKLVVPFVLGWMVRDAASSTGTAGTHPIIKKVAVLTDSSGYGKDGLAVITAELPKWHMTMVANETFNPGDTDMTAQLTKIKNSGADAILLWTAGAEAATIAKERVQLGITTPMFGGSGQGRLQFITGAGSAADGVTFGTGKILVPSSFGTAPNRAVAEDFVARYQAKYGKAPDIFAAHAYDALNIIVEALKRAGANPTPAAVRDEIEKTSGFVGLDGTFTFSPTDHNGLTSNDLVMYIITGGKWVLAK